MTGSGIAKTAIVSAQIRLRHPDDLTVGEHSIVDDFCYFSTQVRIGRFSHVANGCSVAGGRERRFTLGDYSSLSAGVKIWCTSDDFTRGLIFIPAPGMEDVKEFLIAGDVSIGDYSGVGANSVVMPDNVLPEGTAIGALSFVPARYTFEPWSVYAGIPIERVGPRDRDAVMRQVAAAERRSG